MTILGYGDYRYELDDSWPNIPKGWTLGNGWAGPSGRGVSDVSSDSEDNIYVFNRDIHPVVVFDAKSGNFVNSWGEHEFKETHGIYVDSEDNVWTTDRQEHVVVKHTKYGEKLLELGLRGWATASVSPYGSNPERKGMGGPFNMPAGVTVSSTGAIFVADGYGNRQVHRFSPTGKLELSWGNSGTGEGEFSLLHNLDVDSKDRVYICDRENDRIQIFDYDGSFIEIWSDLNSPGSVFCDRNNLVYVAEQGPPRRNIPNGVSIYTESGELISQFMRKREDDPTQPHGICLDSKGNIYLAELESSKKNDQRVSKFVRM